MKITLILLTALVLAQRVDGQPKNHYLNPVLAGFYPDPSICRAGDDYYIVNSSFAYYPGLPIFHSKDLVSWKQIGHALDRPEQLNHTGARITRGLFAPAIAYHNGLFYIVCTEIDRMGNFVITAKDPAGPWSNPKAIPQVNGIDPSLFIEENGTAYILYNSIPPDNKTLYDGHRTIRMYKFDINKLEVTGEEQILINGGTDISKKPVWIEGPHILKKDGWYYLLCAEGGTGYNHSEVVFRSRTVTGPFISFDKNPILTQRHLDPARPFPITTTGHADFVDTKDGKWYAVFLGCRPYDGDHYNTGRETFLAPVKWENEWPIILEGNETVSYSYPLPLGKTKGKKSLSDFSAQVSYRDEFDKNQLNYRWIFLRTPLTNWYSLSEKPGSITMQLRPETCGGFGNPSFIAHRQQNLECAATTSLSFEAKSENEKAGLVVFQDEKHYYFIAKSIKDNKPVIELFRAAADSSMELITSSEIATGSDIELKVEARKDTYAFFFAIKPGKWQLLQEGLDARYLSTKTSGGFVGCTIALYATSLGKPSTSSAGFAWFEYKGNDEVYRSMPRHR